MGASPGLSVVDATDAVVRDHRVQQAMTRKLARSCKKRYEGAYYDPESSGDEEALLEKLPPATRAGRGKKRSAVVESSTDSDSSDEEEEEVLVVPRKRGRPPKKKPAPLEVVKEASEEIQGESETETSRSSMSTAISAPPVLEKKPGRARGRPPKHKESTSVESNLYKLKKAIVLYEYLTLDTGNKRPAARRPFLTRNLPYLNRTTVAGKQKKSLQEAVDSLRAKLNIPVSPKKSLPTVKKEKPLEKQPSLNDPLGLSVLFCRLKHPSHVGLPNADIQVFVCAESDGRFGDVEKVPSSIFNMRVNEEVPPLCIDMPIEVGSPLPKGISTRAHYLVVKVTFYDPPNAGKSLRAGASRRVATSGGVGERHVFIGACCLVEVDKRNGTFWGREKGIILIDANRVNAVNGSEWCRDKTFINRTIEIAKKTVVHPFLLVDFFEDKDDSDSDSEASASVLWPEQKHHRTKTEEFREQTFAAVRHNHEMDLQIPHAIMYNFVAAEDETTFEVADSDFSKQPLGTIVDKAICGRGHRMDLIPDTETTVSRIVNSAAKCIFCNCSFVDMYALMMHLRHSYPRLEFVYRGLHRVLEVPLIEITVSTTFDASNDTNSNEYATGAPHKQPKNSVPVYIVPKNQRPKRAGLSRSLDVFLDVAEQEKRLTELKQPTFFDPRTLHPFYVPPEDASKKNNDQEWRRKCLSTKFDDFVDLDPKEQEFMKLWGIFCLNDDRRPKYRGAFYQACRTFLILHRSTLVDNDLELQWMSHITTYKELNCLDDDQAYDLIQRYFEDHYEPTEDSLHFVSRELHARRLAESKRLKEKDTNAKRERRSRTRSPANFVLRQNKRASSSSRQSSVTRTAATIKPENQAVPKRGRNREPDFSLYLKSYGV